MIIPPIAGTRIQFAHAFDNIRRTLEQDEIVFLSSLPPIEPLTDLELRDLARRRQERIDGRIVSQPQRENFHDL